MLPLSFVQAENTSDLGRAYSSIQYIIKESHSDWTSLVFLVPKAEFKVWFCVNIRNVSAVSNSDVYPVPHLGTAWSEVITLIQH